MKLGGGTVEELLSGARVEVEVACRRVAARALCEPPYDAEGKRSRQDG